MNNQKRALPFDGLYWIIEDAEYLEEYKIKIWFRDGSIKIIDLESELSGGILEPLKDLKLFSMIRFDQDASTVVWSNGADIAPEFLYENGIDVVPLEIKIEKRRA